MRRYDERVALVTGAAQGIGAAIAVRLASEGAAVAVVDLDPAACADTVQAITAEGGRAVAVGADVSVAADVEGAVTATVEAFGALDVLVNNAGVLRDNLLHKMSEDDWDTVIDIHLKGTFLCCRAAQAVMVPRAYGRIVNLSSTSADGNRGQTNYSAAKAGVQGMTRTLALELGRFGITVNAVAPGFISTKMTEATAARMRVTFEQFQESVAASVAVHRVGMPEDIAAAVAYLGSEEAGYVSGRTLYVDGGGRV